MGLRRHRGLSLPPRTFRRYANLLRTPVVGWLLLRSVRAQYRRLKFPKYETMSAFDFAVQFDAFSAADFDLVRRSCAALRPPKTLVAYTADDHLVEEEIPRELAAAIPGARTIRFDSGGHIIQKTRAIEIGAAIRDLVS
jgi:pimeloyl-ACP methyl ester carboxylesterase